MRHIMTSAVTGNVSLLFLIDILISYTHAQHPYITFWSFTLTFHYDFFDDISEHLQGRVMHPIVFRDLALISTFGLEASVLLHFLIVCFLSTLKSKGVIRIHIKVLMGETYYHSHAKRRSQLAKQLQVQWKGHENRSTLWNHCLLLKTTYFDIPQKSFDG